MFGQRAMMRIPPGEGVSGNAIARRQRKDGGGKRKRRKNGATPGARLVVDRLEASDAGAYKCRTDFERSPTRNHRVDLKVLGELLRSGRTMWRATFPTWGKCNFSESSWKNVAHGRRVTTVE